MDAAIVVVAVWRKQKNKRWKQAEVDRMLFGVYNVLEEYHRFTECLWRNGY